MDNGMENMLDMYLFETNSLLEQLDELLIDAEKVGDFSVDNVNEIFRIMHTIKGSSAMMEFNSIMTIAHRIEDLFFYIRENGIEQLGSTHKRELFDLMFRSTDSLRTEVDKVENNLPLSSNIDNFVSEINTFLDKISKSRLQKLSAADPVSSESDVPKPAELPFALNIDCPDFDSPYFLRIFFEDGVGMENLRALMLVTSLEDADISFTYYPKELESIPANSSLITEKGFYVCFEDTVSADNAVTVIKGSSNIRSYELLENPIHKKENIPDAKAAPDTAPLKAASDSPAQELVNPANTKPDPIKPLNPAAPANNPAHMASKQSLISVNLSKLDSLMAVVGEIVITESMVTSSPELKGLKLDSFLKSSRQLRKLTDELQDIAMSLRMVPVSGVFQKMNRIIRDMKQRLNKDVKLVILGEDTEVDKSIVDSIGDPIMHIVRNSMDHGIEANPRERIAAGKSPQGTITLSAKHTGSEVIISVNDDGRGMDTAQILAKAARNGILTKPESEYTKKEILNLLMLPGFSTNEQVTEFSGRGVGMDVVKKNVESVGGIVTITSDAGLGSCTTLKIPLTLSIVDGMEIAVGKSIFTIPIANIRQTFKASADQIIYDADGDEIIECMGAFYPITRLHRLYNIETDITQIEDGILVWVEAGDKSYCLFLDELLGEQQVVVKPIPSFLNNFNIKHSGITGCTILGDGNISIILDIMTLYDVAHNQY